LQVQVLARGAQAAVIETQVDQQHQRDHHARGVQRLQRAPEGSARFGRQGLQARDHGRGRYADGSAAWAALQ
jgi:hypothetical protein